MAMKEKKSLTTCQNKRKYKALSIVCFGGEFLSIATPYLIMGAVNWNDWFVYNEEGWKIGLGGSLALALMSIAVFVITKKKEDDINEKTNTSGYIGLLLGWIATAFIFLLLSDIMHQIANIMFFGAIGIGGALGLEITSKSFEKKAKQYQEMIDLANSEIIKEEAREEILKEKEEKKKVKISVKK